MGAKLERIVIPEGAIQPSKPWRAVSRSFFIRGNKMNEIETMFWDALEQLLKSNQYDNIFQNEDWTTSILFQGKATDLDKEILYAKLVMASNNYENKRILFDLQILQQLTIGRYRADFNICICGIIGIPPISFVIEIDGHEWHEKNKQQVARDKIRERSIVSAGYTILRYSGSEVFNNALGCANDCMGTIIDSITNIWPLDQYSVEDTH
jgi:very-short-patch-repair endonuclease